MMKGIWLFIKILLAIAMTGTALYAYIAKRNQVTELQLAIPALAKEVRAIEEENKRLQYEIDQFESPAHLLELLKKPEFSHLKFPYENEVIELNEDQ